jgi:hypothetical protein
MNAAPSHSKPLSRFTRALVGCAIVVATLIARYLLVRQIEALHPPNWYTLGPDIFYVLAGTYEPQSMAIVAAAALLFVVTYHFSRCRTTFVSNLSWRGTVLIAITVFAFCFWGTTAVYHRFPISLDENAAFFQARAFVEGHLTSSIPPNLIPYSTAVVPEFIEHLSGDRIVSSYFPIYAALLALGHVLLGTPWVMNPLLSASSVLLIFGIARQVDNSNAFAGWSVLLLATSAQFLVNGMSAYAMPSHLFFNLAWLYFYTNPNRRLYYLCPLLGVLALGLHNPFPHALFVIPFLFRLLLDHRWPEAVYSAIVYLAGGIVWIYWMHVMRPEVVAVAEKIFVFPGAQAGFIFLLSMLRLVSWQNFLAVLFFVAALPKVRSMPPFFRDLVAGLALTIVFYLFFVRSQGACWGYRYVHQVLGNLVLIAAWSASRQSIPRLSFVLVTAVALFVQLPFCCHEAYKIVGRQAHAYGVISHLNADFVIIDRNAGYSGVELMRNDPDFTNRPILLFRASLTEDQFNDLMQHHKAVLISREQYIELGVPVLK